jgi:hypothetical protein
LECDDGASAASGYDGGDEATSTPDTDLAHLQESETVANPVPATTNMENATALAVQSQALQPREDQVGIYLSKT